MAILCWTLMTFTDGRTEEHPIGLDGRIKRSPGGRYNLPVGVKGYWENNHDFILDYDEIANINRLRFQIGFAGDQISIQMTEMTSEFKTTFELDFVHSEIGARADLRMDKVTFNC